MMAEIKNVFDISGRAMAAQLVRLNTIASNLANAGNFILKCVPTGVIPS